MNKERPQPYIGISGVVNTCQQHYLMDQFAQAGFDELQAPRQIALGVKAVHKTQYLDTENKYGTDWYPVGEKAFANALDDRSTVSLQVAQTYFDAEYVRDPEYRKAFVERICRRGKAWLNAIQFDLLPWHEDESMLSFLEEVKEGAGHSILLQVHSEAMQTLGPEGVARKLSRYADVIDYVLFDASHGKGVRMDSEALRPFLYAAHSSSKLESTGFGAAGGLNAEVVREELPALLEEYPGLSWDAEGQLHPARPDGTRPLDMERVKEYLEASSEVLGKV